MAIDEGMPAYTVFTDEELAEMAKVESLTAEAMKKIKGIGDKKVARFAEHFISKKDEKG